MRHVCTTVVAALIAVLPARLQAQQPAPHSWQSLRVELGYSHWPDRGNPHGTGATLKFVHALGPTVALDAGIIAAKENPSVGDANIIGLDGGIELRLRLAPSLRLLLGAGAGVVSASQEYVTAFPRLSSGMAVALGDSPVTLRAIVHTTIPPFPADKSPNSLVAVGAEYRLSRRK